jgi:hypothetical protein
MLTAGEAKGVVSARASRRSSSGRHCDATATRAAAIRVLCAAICPPYRALQIKVGLARCCRFAHSAAKQAPSPWPGTVVSSTRSQTRSRGGPPPVPFSQGWQSARQGCGSALRTAGGEAWWRHTRLAGGVECEPLRSGDRPYVAVRGVEHVRRALRVPESVTTALCASPVGSGRFPAPATRRSTAPGIVSGRAVISVFPPERLNRPEGSTTRARLYRRNQDESWCAPAG